MKKSRHGFGTEWNEELRLPNGVQTLWCQEAENHGGDRQTMMLRAGRAGDNAPATTANASPKQSVLLAAVANGCRNLFGL